MPSRSTKISLLLAVDVVFFFIELIAGYAVGSLALVADSFHMLNDVLSLIVALYAIKLSKSEASPEYSYGWHRAEIVAALVNGVFLLALCFSIFMEAIERFFNTPEITNAKLVVIVGTFGLASNFLGLFLFHEHGHSHEHAPKSKASDSKPVRSSVTDPLLPVTVSDVAEPEEVPRQRSDSFNTLYGHPAATRASVVQVAQDFGYGRPISPTTQLKIPVSISHDRSSSLTSLPKSISKNNVERGEPSRRPGDVLIDNAETSDSDTRKTNQQLLEGVSGPIYTDHSSEVEQNGHKSHQARSNSAQGGSHGSMNMHALLLHVIGDALSNVGVIATGLIMWLSTWQYKYYFDPVISLIITFIIFSSALPLVRSASFILLQAVPSTVSLEDVRTDIQKVDDVLSVHELHVWQLSENKIVASVHVRVSRSREYMLIALDIRKILHDHGVHSSTIQPEFTEDSEPDMLCLIPCPPDEVCQPENACCPPPKPPSPPLVDI